MKVNNQFTPGTGASSYTSQGHQRSITELLRQNPLTLLAATSVIGVAALVGLRLFWGSAKQSNPQEQSRLAEDLLPKPEANMARPARVEVPSLLRIWGGKYTPSGERPRYQAVGKKTAGGAPGFIAEEVVPPPKVKRYLAKSGFLKDEQKVSESLSSGTERHYRSYLSIIKEFIAAHLYTLLGAQAFYVPKHRLSMMDEVSQGLHLLSRWIEDYQDLAKLETCYLEADDQTPASVQACIKAGRIPEYASIEGRRVPILGLIEVLAASRLLGDTDVLGGHLTNAGFVVESQDGAPVAVRVVKIDAGEAFGFAEGCNKFASYFKRHRPGNALQDPKDLQSGNMVSRVIFWDKLLDQQKQRFLRTLRWGYEVLQDERLVDFMIHQRGSFDEATPGRTLLRPAMVAKFKEEWRDYMDKQMLPEVYGNLPAAKIPASLVPFNPKPVGAACGTFEEARTLSRSA
jgi:hypothetical protein